MWLKHIGEGPVPTEGFAISGVGFPMRTVCGHNSGETLQKGAEGVRILISFSQAKGQSNYLLFVYNVYFRRHYIRVVLNSYVFSGVVTASEFFIY